jgi:hypothetical protein
MERDDLRAYVRTVTRILISAGQGWRTSLEVVGPWRVGAAFAAMALVLAGCDRPYTTDAPVGAPADRGGYLPPPTLTAAARDSDGETALSGLAPAGTEVRLRDPDGAAYSATADRDGSWAVRLPPSAEPHMFSFEGALDDRVLHAEGAILVLPAPGPPAMLTRAGFGALPLGGSGRSDGGLRILSIDEDGGGGGAVSGYAAPRAPARLVLDNVAVGMGEADDQGRFTLLDLSARTPFSPGPHVIRVESRSAAVQGALTVERSPPLGAAPFVAARTPSGWRVDWRIPGGGQQTTLVFDLPNSPAAPVPPKPRTTP